MLAETAPTLISDRESRWSISALAAAFGVTARTIRYYEDQGLLTPERVGQARYFLRADRARLAWILRGKAVGFSLGDIAEMLALYNAGDGRASQRRVTLDKCRARIAGLSAQREAIDATIAELETFIRTLDGAGPDQQGA